MALRDRIGTATVMQQPRFRLLELSGKSESGEGSSDIDLHEVVASAVERARRRGPRLCFDVDLEPWRVHGDARGTLATIQLPGTAPPA